MCVCTRVQVFFEPTDRRKAVKPFRGQHKITYASPNLMELRAIANFIKPDNIINKSNELDEIIELSKVVSNFVDLLMVTRGSKGVVTIKRVNNLLKPSIQEFDVQVYATDILSNVENVSGAGDCFASGFIHGVLLDLRESHSLSIGFKTAKQALLNKGTVPLKFNL